MDDIYSFCGRTFNIWSIRSGIQSAAIYIHAILISIFIIDIIKNGVATVKVTIPFILL